MTHETELPESPTGSPADREASPAESPRDTERVPVVGIGASAGGLKALQELVAEIPADSGMAYVVILHLDPDRESRMTELLQDQASIPVTEIHGPTRVEADHVYVSPPDQDLEMLRDATIGVRKRSERSERVPIDLFMRSLAETAGPDAVGVVLSGTGSDGTAGIRFIRDAGGITVAQSPKEAEYEGMPESAIATGMVDLVLPSSQIPDELLRVRRGPSPLGREPSPPGAEEDEDDPDVEAELAPIFAALRARTGHDFSMYKRATVLRRLDRRLLFNNVDTLAEYLRLLQTDEAEAGALMRDLLISVSAFFRDPEEFEALAEIVPALFEGKGPDDTVRVWVVGCATGEEVYSVAMVLAEHAAELDDPPEIEMFATDIDEKGYAWGREALYPPATVARIAPERLERFFTREAGGYRINKSLREMVLFAVHNVLRDPPFARMDLITCRNLFIYLQSEAQEQALETFHYALNSEGMLFLGASESAGEERLFTPVEPGPHRIFQRNGTRHRVLPRLSAADPLPRTRKPRAGSDGDGDGDGDGAGDGKKKAGRTSFSYGALHVHMLEQYAPPSVIVDRRWDMVHLSDGAGRFLRLSEGEPSRRLLDLAPDGLRGALRTGLHQAFENGAPTVRVVRAELEGTERAVTVHVRPGVVEGKGPGFALVVFEEGGAAVERASVTPAADKQRHDVASLEDELRRTREQLESERAAHDRTVAELQTVNEELLSINEEQKAAAEELETGREEIQAINEELTSINQEHQSTIEELKRTNADLQNLIESTEIGTIFVDREKRIRRFTPPVADVFNFAATDHGRPLGDITHRLDYPGLAGDVTRVLESLERVEREVVSDSGEWFIVRINPYRNHDGEIDGAVLTFFDHTDRHRVDEELREAKMAAEAANEAKGTFLSTLSHELRTPLSSVMGYADLLQMTDSLTDQQDERVERIKMGGRHLDAMIGQLLSFTRLDGGREAVETEEVDARELVGDVRQLMAPLAEEQDLAMYVQVPSEAVPLTTDVGKARQILVNLCGNAVKYTEAGEVRLRVHTHEGRVMFEVRDTGVGIAPEHHDLVFERFWQADGSSTRHKGGLGIGLAAAREYARLLGGDVELESAPDEGSTFTLWLPEVYGAGDVASNA